MTSEGPHHPGQEPDEVSPGAGGSAPYGDRSAQQDRAYGTAAPDLGWAPPPPAARPSSPAPAWSAPGEAPPTVGWKAPGEQPQPGQWGPPPGQPWGGQPGQPASGNQAPSGNWDPQADQQQPTAAWAAAPVPPQQPAWGQGDGPGAPQPAWGQNDSPNAPQPGGWAPQGDSPQQNWPARGQAQQGWPSSGEQSARGQQSPAPWGPPAEPASGAPWNGPDQQPQTPTWGAAPVAEQSGQPSPAAWGQQEQQPAWGQQNDQQQPGDWGSAPAAQQSGPQSPGARGSASVRPQGDSQPAWGSSEPAPGAPWGGPDQQPQTPTWGAASVPQQAEPQQAGFDAPAQQPRPAEAWPPAEPTSAPPARATASVRADSAPAWGAPPARSGDDAVPARPAVPEGEPWSADEVWGKAASDNTPEESGNAPAWESPRADSSPMYQPAPGPGISPANAVPLPPQETRVPGASLAAAQAGDYAPPAPYGEPAGRDSGYEAEQPGDGWGAEAQSAAAPAIPHPRTSPESGGGGEPGGSISASASVPVSSRVMPPTDQALRPSAMPAPQPRVYGRPSRPEQSEHGDGQPEPHRFDDEPGGRFDDEPGARFDGGPGTRFDDPEPRFDGRPGDQFDNGPGGPFDGRPGGRFDGGGHGNPFDGGPGGRFDNGPGDRFDGPEQRFDAGPGNRFDQQDRPGGFGDGPAAAPVPQPALPSFPPGMPSFADPATNQRPVNGTKPHSEPAHNPGDRFSGAAAPVSGGAVGHGGAPGHGSADATRGFPAAFPPGGDQPERPLWDLGDSAAGPADQGRFDAFKPDAAEAKPAEPPAPKVRNGRVLMAVLTAAVLILVVPLGLLMLLGKIGGSDNPPAFSPAVGSCVKQSGNGAVAAGCGDQGAFKVVSRVDNQSKCADPAQPHVVLPGNGADRVLCLAPATAG
ncbi:LppU/SCO3897 family protein [Micromonospora cathayae]|uniref:Integrin beta 8 n=1 Tax=Micromonospora cathayae TaxID=3028804 RepID=A0ABY7ZTH7_9ACTN|nr:hypothetical protein [Micromonospora sp. HUAS 3]WDZ86116.1 hypothetical protein PVK37_06770 [Micromonospora sp. HUAS 3]